MGEMLRDRSLVLGGSGFLGAHVVTAAARRGRVVSASRDPRPPAYARAWGDAVEDARVDALEPGGVERLLDELAPARIAVCTALSSIDTCQSYPGLARAINGELPRRVARWCRERGARLVHVSTDLVFGATAPPQRGYREADPPSPMMLYGRTKADGEAAVLDACPAALVVRIPLLYGDSGGRGRGASDSLLGALERGDPARLFTDEWRSPLEVSNAADALVELLHGSRSGILHVAGPDRLTRYDLGLLVLASRGVLPEQAVARLRQSTRAEAGLDAVRPADACLDTTLARATLATPLLPVVRGLLRPTWGDLGGA